MLSAIESIKRNEDAAQISEEDVHSIILVKFHGLIHSSGWTLS